MGVIAPARLPVFCPGVCVKVCVVLRVVTGLRGTQGWRVSKVLHFFWREHWTPTPGYGDEESS